MNTKIKHIRLLRTIGCLLPLKGKLDFLISMYFKKKNFLKIPFEKNYAICIQPSNYNHSTINEFIFLGSKYLPENFLFHRIKKSLPEDFDYVDVGSNLGTTILKFYTPKASMIGFEPMPHLYRSIEETIRENKFENINIFNKAVGDRTGIVKMVLNDNSSIVNNDNLNENWINVPLTTLDAELSQVKKIDLIKIDVEGFEWQVLQGARQVIEKHLPALLIEIHPFFLLNYKVDINLILSYLEQKGYTISYFSFLEELRLSRVNRFLSRYFLNKGKQFNTKNDFLKDTLIKPAIPSYHIYCEQ